MNGITEKAAPVAPAGQGNPVLSPRERKSGPIKRPLDPRALARAAGVILGLGPRDTKFMVEFLAAAQNNSYPNLVCIRCGSHGLKKNAVVPTSPLSLVINMREVSPRMSFLLGFARNLQMEPKYARDDCIIVNGLCRRCQMDLGAGVPSILRVPALDDDDADQLRQIVIDLCLAGKASEAYERLRPLLE